MNMNSRRMKRNNDSFVKKKSYVKRQIENFRASRVESNTDLGKLIVSEMLNRKWKVFRVSPLYNFSFNKLKFFEKELNEIMNSKRKLSSNAGYKSDFTVSENFQLNDHHVKSLKVKIIKDETQTAYLGHFLTWNSTNLDMEGSISLPILLVEAKIDEMHAVHSAFSKIFDCDIQGVTFSLYALISFFAKLLETLRNNIDASQEQVSLEYGLLDCKDNDKINISLCLEDITVLFAVVMENLRESNTEISTMEIILEFYNKILNHIHHVFNLDFKFAELRKVSYPDAFLSSDGQLKMSTNEAALSALDVLKHFTPIDAVISM